MLKEARVILDSPAHNADLFWATKFFCPDTIVYVEVDGEKVLIADSFEFGRACEEARVDCVLSIDEYCVRGEHYFPSETPDLRNLSALHAFLQERAVGNILVHPSFWDSHGSVLRVLGYTVQHEPSFYPQRMVKNDEEISAVAEAMQATESAIDDAVSMLKRARIGPDGRLFFKEKIVTSEMLRDVIDTKLWELGYLAEHTIVASGEQSAQPHHEGSGPIHAYVPVIIDVFPRSKRNGYYADITRTFLKGSAPGRLQVMYRDVFASQEAALAALRPGLGWREVYHVAAEALSDQGHPIYEGRAPQEGFLHGLGHGLGLEIHEFPRLSPLAPIDKVLEAGNVVTIEPGLYYAATGGVRIEDTVVITDNGYRNLTHFPKDTWEIL